MLAPALKTTMPNVTGCSRLNHLTVDGLSAGPSAYEGANGLFKSVRDGIKGAI
jgi:hypothetical protein